MEVMGALRGLEVFSWRKDIFLFVVGCFVIMSILTIYILTLKKSKKINPNCLDCIGLEIADGDLILLYNGNQNVKKWSWEKVVLHNGELCSVFKKYMNILYTSLKDTPPEWIILIRSKEMDMIFHQDDIVLPK